MDPKNLNFSVIIWSDTKFSQLRLWECVAERKENYYWDLESERVQSR